MNDAPVQILIQDVPLMQGSILLEGQNSVPFLPLMSLPLLPLAADRRARAGSPWLQEAAVFSSGTRPCGPSCWVTTKARGALLARLLNRGLCQALQTTPTSHMLHGAGRPAAPRPSQPQHWGSHPKLP